MMRFSLFLWMLLLSLLPAALHAQCNSSTGTAKGTITPTIAWQTITAVGGGQYWTFNGDPCNTYTFSFCQQGGTAGFDTQLTITDNTGAPISGAFNDDNCSTQSELTWTPAATGTYRIYVTKYSCAKTGTGATLAYAMVSMSNVNQEYSLVDDATSTAPYKCVILTPNTTTQRGCAWDVNSTLDMTMDFSYDFTINLGSSDAGADGMAFVMQNDPRGRCACGTPGGSLGAGGITKSLIVEIDTYLNAEDRDDGMAGVVCSGGAEPDHLDIWTNGNVNPAGSGCPTPAGARIIPAAVPFMSGGTSYNIENGSDHLFRLSWTASSQTLKVSVINTGGAPVYGTVSYSFNPMTVFGTNNPYFGFTASTGGLSNQQSFCEPAALLLPVDLVYFNGACAAEGNVLKWATSAEKNNSYFSLMRSSDGVVYEELARISARGAAGSYSYTDADFWPGDNYYQLRQTDNNGETKYYNIVGLSCGTTPSTKFRAYQSENNIAIEIVAALDEEAILSLHDITGKLIFTQKISLQKGSDQFKIPVNVADGMYVISLNSGGSALNQKVLLGR